MNVTEHRPIDHKRLVYRRKAETQRAISMYAGLEGVNKITITHEADDSCCKKEAWPITLAWILSQAKKRTLYITD